MQNLIYGNKERKKRKWDFSDSSGVSCHHTTHAVAQLVVCNDQVCAMIALSVDIDEVLPDTGFGQEACILQLSCCNETQDNTEGLT